MQKISDNQIAVLGTVLLHSIIILIFGIISIDYSKNIPEYVDLVISSGLLRAENKDVSDITERDIEAKSQENDLDLNKFNQIFKKDQNVLIDIPERVSNVREIEIPEIQKKDLDKNIQPYRTEKEEARMKKTSYLKPENYKLNSIKEESKIGRKGEVLKNLPSLEAGRGTSELKSFSIEWLGTEREKISGELPKFPEGVKIGGVVKIRFFVKPDGTVGELIPIIKSNYQLEEVSLKSLKNWRFSKLDKEAPQVNQEGIITFIYKLK